MNSTRNSSIWFYWWHIYAPAISNER